MTVREQGCSAGAGNERLGASDGDLGAAAGLLRPTSQVTQALRSGLRLTERVWPHLPLNHTVMQAKPAPLGVTRSLMTRGSAATNLNNKQRTTHRLEIVWQPAPNAKCMRGDDGCGWGRDPRGTFRPHVYISVGGRLGCGQPLGRWPLGCGQPLGGRVLGMWAASALRVARNPRG